VRHFMAHESELGQTDYEETSLQARNQFAG
jgi:hypothetical protein